MTPEELIPRIENAIFNEGITIYYLDTVYSARPPVCALFSNMGHIFIRKTSNLYDKVNALLHEYYHYLAHFDMNSKNFGPLAKKCAYVSDAENDTYQVTACAEFLLYPNIWSIAGFSQDVLTEAVSLLSRFLTPEEISKIKEYCEKIHKPAHNAVQLLSPHNQDVKSEHGCTMTINHEGKIIPIKMM